MSLAARPQGEGAVWIPHRRARVGLDIALVNRGGAGFVLDDDIRLFKALLKVARAEFEMVRQVRALAIIVIVFGATGSNVRIVQGCQALVQQGCAVF